MRFRTIVLAAALSVAAAQGHAAGLKFLEVPADASGPALEAAQWSPCAAPAEETKVGAFVFRAVPDCPIAGGKRPLVVISHGFGGSYVGHHDLAEVLADAGFIVVALNHPGDTTANTARARNVSALIDRPTDVKRLIDYLLGASPDAPKIDSNRIGFFGFSRGGYTGLVLGGANPDFNALRAPCADPTGATCAPRSPWPAHPLTHDPRIKAIVAADPLSSVFAAPDSVKAVTVSLQLWASARGGDGVSPEAVATLVRNLPVKPEVHVVPNSGHFAFLIPCPPAAKAPPELCVDSPGFDRAAFHVELNQRILAFLRLRLAAP